MQIETNTAEEQDVNARLAHVKEMEAVGKAIGQVVSAGSSVAYVVGTIATGAVAIAAQGEALNGLSTLYIVARDRADSLSALTFTIEQVVNTPYGLQVYQVATLTSTPGNPATGYFYLPQPNTPSTLRAVVSAAPASPSGVDNYVLNVSGY